MYLLLEHGTVAGQSGSAAKAYVQTGTDGIHDCGGVLCGALLYIASLWVASLIHTVCCSTHVFHAILCGDILEGTTLCSAVLRAHRRNICNVSRHFRECSVCWKGRALLG
jgi:hypothetical protein